MLVLFYFVNHSRAELGSSPTLNATAQAAAVDPKRYTNLPLDSRLCNGVAFSQLPRDVQSNQEVHAQRQLFLMNMLRYM
jgi:hypothetical protein